ncbi:MAG: diacylglycerol kinase family protein [Mycoplasmoidaceae bacterium]
MERRVKSSFVKKFIYAVKGLYTAIKEEPSLIIQFIIGGITLIIAGILHKEMHVSDWAIIVIVIGLTTTLEIINTAIENICDMVSFKYNKNTKKIKDISAAATLLFSISAVVTGLIIFIPKIESLVNGKS